MWNERDEIMPKSDMGQTSKRVVWKVCNVSFVASVQSAWNRTSQEGFKKEMNTELALVHGGLTN